MRLLIVSAITSLLAAGIQAQSLSEHAAAAAGATIGTAAGKPLSNAITKIFGSVDNDAKKAAATKANAPKVQTKESKESTPTPSMSTPTLGGSSTPSIGSTSSPSTAAAPGSSRRQRRDAASASSETTTVSLPVVSVPAVQEPARVEPTAEQFVSVKVGATAKEVLAVLGAPASRVTIPDEGHMLEICQYWAKGKQLGTIRLDNGQVVTVQSSAQN